LDCFAGVEHADLSGEVQCLDRVPDGYCTHLCETDDDCCAADGECATDLRQVCAPFESTGQRMCFLSCEDEDLRLARDGGVDLSDTEYCEREASALFGCRSTGGGAANRKVCLPKDCGEGSVCGDDADCVGDLSCLLHFTGGYCGTRGCAGDADCPGDSVCVEGPGGNHCLATCTADADCGQCRDAARAAACTDDVVLVEAQSVQVCRPALAPRRHGGSARSASPFRQPARRSSPARTTTRRRARPPTLVLAYEPTGNLDPRNAAESHKLIREACQENSAALLLVSHEKHIL
jgi:hypothetical protein